MTLLEKIKERINIEKSKSLPVSRSRGPPHVRTVEFEITYYLVHNHPRSSGDNFI